MNAALQLVDISKLGLNSKIKKFSYSFICGKGRCLKMAKAGHERQRLFSIIERSNILVPF